jgi:two-component system, cell cycle sensor histidine kinase and response regulator CckA
VDDYVGHLREFRRILRNLETQTTHPLNRETILALTKKLDRDESQLNADRLERSIRATVEATASLEDLEHYEQDVLSVFQEIVSRKRRELERERFRNLLDHSGEAIFVVEPHTGRFLDVNQSAARMLGYTREDLLGLQLSHIEVALPLTPPAAWQDWVASIRGAAEVLYAEGVHRRKDGSRFPVELSVGFASSDGQQLLLLVSRDITERKRSEARLRRQWAFFSRLVHRSIDGIMAFDRSFNVTYWNPAMERILGERKTKVLGKNMLQVLPQLKELGEDRFFRDALAGTTTTSRNRAYTHAENGRQVYFDGYYSPLTEDTGEILGGIGILRDVTERRETQLRQAREALARMDEQRLAQLDVQRHLESEISTLKHENERLAKGLNRSTAEREEHFRSGRVEGLEVLASGLAREVEPLIAGILSQTGVALAELPPDSPLRKGVEQIEEAALSANALANTLSAFSKNGRTDVHRVQLEHLLREMEHTLRAAVKPNATLELATGAPGGTNGEASLPLIRGDSRQMRDLVLALVANASEALGEEGGMVRVSTGTMEVDSGLLNRAYLGKGKSPGSYVFLEVSDSGEGMDEETLAKIFVPFFSTRSGHRGLGLATVLGIVRSHGGVVTVDSRPGAGTTTRAMFPVS